MTNVVETTPDTNTITVTEENRAVTVTNVSTNVVEVNNLAIPSGVATKVTFTPYGTLTATNVQAAIEQTYDYAIPVTLNTTTADYLSLSGQQITLGQINLTTDVTGALSIANGGTGATSAADARTNLNVDEAGTDNSTDVTLAGSYDYLTLSGQAITLGQIDLATDTTGTLALTSGGTGATSAADARTNLGLVIGTDVLAHDANLQSFVNTFTLPTVDGSVGQFIKTDGSGTLSFATVQITDEDVTVANLQTRLGQISTDTNIGTGTANFTFSNDVTVSGDLTVLGTSTTINTNNLDVEDSVITLNTGQSTASNDIGLLFQRYSSPTAANYNFALIWDENTDALVAGETTEDGSDLDITLTQRWMSITASNLGIGYNAGATTQGESAVAMGNQAGRTTQGANSVAMGYYAGNNTQGTNAIAMGYQAGQTTQGGHSVAMGYFAGTTTQGTNAIAMGVYAGQTTQGNNTVAIGQQAGKTSQGNSTVAIGSLAGFNSQTAGAVAIGATAGQNSQGLSAIAIGESAGTGTATPGTEQGNYAVAMGYYAGNNTQGASAIAMGNQAGRTTQGTNSVAMGPFAGTTTQGDYAVAMGFGAGYASQGANGIIINSSGATLDDTSAGHIHIASDDGSLDFVTANGWSFSGGGVTMPGFTVATLPTGAAGMIARVTDASSPSIGSTVTGGGAAYALVNYNGTNWTVIGI